MRLVITGETTAAAAGTTRAAALAQGWMAERPTDSVEVHALGRGPADAEALSPGRLVVLGRPGEESWRDTDLTGAVVYLADTAVGEGDWADTWQALERDHGGWRGVRAWLGSAGRIVAGTTAPLLGADSVLATFAQADPAAADGLRRRLTALIGDIEAAAGTLPLIQRAPAGRAPGSGAGMGLGEIAWRLGLHVTDTALALADAWEEHGAWRDADLAIHVGAGLNTWDLPGSVTALAAERAAAWAIPTVAVATQVGIGARERGEWGIDGALEAQDSAAALRVAGSRLARTWAFDIN
ncbi:MAG: glycerate kinase [Actinomycetaceae bacterium]|nr:glycerate kinase [Actinomycetaceae bacterium]MDU0969383.1 glycerate kinase [Actinomycetaceae bacterium]